MEDNKSEKNQSSFQLNTFMKEKILKMYGIKNDPILTEKNYKEQNKAISSLFPYDNDDV